MKRKIVCNKRSIYFTAVFIMLIGVLNVAYVACGEGFNGLDQSSNLVLGDPKYVAPSWDEVKWTYEFREEVSGNGNTHWIFSGSYQSFDEVKVTVAKSNDNLIVGKTGSQTITISKEKPGSVTFDAQYEVTDPQTGEKYTWYAITTVAVGLMGANTDTPIIRFKKTTAHYDNPNHDGTPRVNEAGHFEKDISLTVPGESPDPESDTVQYYRRIKVSYTPSGKEKEERLTYGVSDLSNMFFHCKEDSMVTVVISHILIGGEWTDCNVSNDSKKNHCATLVQRECGNLVTIDMLELRSELSERDLLVVTRASNIQFSPHDNAAPPASSCEAPFHMENDRCVLGEGIFRLGYTDVIYSNGLGAYCRYGSCELLKDQKGIECRSTEFEQIPRVKTVRDTDEQGVCAG